MKRKFTVLTSALLASTMILSSCGANNNNNGPKPQKKSQSNHAEISKNSVNLTSTAKGVKDLPDTGSIKMSDEQKIALSKVYQNLYATVMKSSNKDENVLLSPTSLVMDFGMLENGADGNTLKELEEVINGGISVEEFNKLMYEQYKRYTSSKDLTFNIANSIWINSLLHENAGEDFLNKSKSFYNSEVFKSPFNDATKQDIDAWCNEKTNGMIPKLDTDLSPASSMNLINAIAFEAEWETPFNDDSIHEDCDFTNSDNTTSKVNYLTFTDNSYFKYEGGLGFTKEYKGGKYAYFAMLPPEDMTTAEYIAKLQKDNVTLSDLISHKEQGEVKVSMPEFETRYKATLNKPLIDMGIKDGFNADKANFSKLFDTDKNNQYIGYVDQYTYIKVNREGTKAAAVTNIGMYEACLPMTENVIINLDRPFIYGIVDLETNLPIFIGSQNSMK